ncbi:unnamed protein product [Amoebophrya sp. A120]|nr:unnamed protein product [Amoebophrya sp. A120]|eukprot:GSA120T00012374001.1
MFDGTTVSFSATFQGIHPGTSQGIHPGTKIMPSSPAVSPSARDAPRGAAGHRQDISQPMIEEVINQQIDTGLTDNQSISTTANLAGNLKLSEMLKKDQERLHQTSQDQQHNQTIYLQPHLNKRLVLNHKGFQEPPKELDKYVNLAHLDLSFNGMFRLKNLNRLQELLSLQLQSNLLERIQNLDFNKKLQKLNLSYNKIAKIEVDTLRHLKFLNNLNLSHNKLTCFPVRKVMDKVNSILETVEEDTVLLAPAGGMNKPFTGCSSSSSSSSSSALGDDDSAAEPVDQADSEAPLSVSENTFSSAPTRTTMAIEEDTENFDNAVEFAEELLAVARNSALTNLDLSWNEFKDFEVPDCCEFFQKFPNLEVLYFHRNPGLRFVTNYRRHMVLALPKVRYLDEAPIFDREREFATAFFNDGGLAGEKRARDKYKQALREAKPTEDWDDRKHFVTARRNKALERIRAEEDTKQEKHSQYYEYLKKQEKREKEFVEKHQSQWDMCNNPFGEGAQGAAEGGLRAGNDAVMLNDDGEDAEVDLSTTVEDEDPVELERRATFRCTDAPSLNPEVGGMAEEFDKQVSSWVEKNIPAETGAAAFGRINLVSGAGASTSAPTTSSRTTSATSAAPAAVVAKSRNNANELDELD